MWAVNGKVGSRMTVWVAVEWKIWNELAMSHASPGWRVLTPVTTGVIRPTDPTGANEKALFGSENVPHPPTPWAQLFKIVWPAGTSGSGNRSVESAFDPLSTAPSVAR
jgi:hypothetical protein